MPSYEDAFEVTILAVISEKLTYAWMFHSRWRYTVLEVVL